MLVLNTKSFRNIFYYSPWQICHYHTESSELWFFLFLAFDFVYDSDKHLEVEHIAYVNRPSVWKYIFDLSLQGLLQGDSLNHPQFMYTWRICTPIELCFKVTIFSVKFKYLSFEKLQQETGLGFSIHLITKLIWRNKYS